MSSYAIVAEGITDQIVIQRIIEQVLGDEEPDVSFLQPTRDLTDQNRAGHGGWELVFEFCESRFEDALVTNDYVIVQIDTDCGEHPRFGLPLTESGIARHPEQLSIDAAKILSALIGSPLYEENRDRVIFAISVHSLENWLLLILYNDNNASTGFKRLNRRLERADKPSLVKTPERYEALAREIKRKRLMELANGRDSLSCFLGSLIATGASLT